MTRLDDVLIVTACAVVCTAWLGADCSPPRQRRIHQGSDDLGAPPAPSAPGVEGEVPALRSGPPYEIESPLGGRLVGYLHTPRTSSPTAVSVPSESTPRLVDAHRYERVGLFGVGVGLVNQHGHIREFNGASNRVRAAVERNEQKNDGDGFHGEDT